MGNSFDSGFKELSENLNSSKTLEELKKDLDSAILNKVSQDILNNNIKTANCDVETKQEELEKQKQNLQKELPDSLKNIALEEVLQEIEKTISYNKTKADFEPTQLSVAVIKEKNILKNIIEKVFKDITNEEKKSIQKKWAFSLDEKDVNFTKEELIWIKNNPVVKIGADSYWPPFDYLNSSGIHDGISSEYINLLSKHTGLKFEVDSDIWNNLMTKIKDKKFNRGKK